jgi:hypothetical protein
LRRSCCKYRLSSGLVALLVLQANSVLLSVLPRQLLRQTAAMPALRCLLPRSGRLLLQATSLHGAILLLWLQRLLRKAHARDVPLLLTARFNLRAAEYAASCRESLSIDCF